MSKNPSENKFHKGNGEDGKHYWLTPPTLYQELCSEFNFDFDPCPFPLPDGFDGLTSEWGSSNYVNPPFGSIMHQGSNDKKPKKKGPTAWVRKCIEEKQKGNRSVMVFPIDKWVLMMIQHCSEIRNLGDVKWLATEDASEGKGLGRHIAMFVLDPSAKTKAELQDELKTWEETAEIHAKAMQVLEDRNSELKRKLKEFEGSEKHHARCIELISDDRANYIEKVIALQRKLDLAVANFDFIQNNAGNLYTARKYAKTALEEIKEMK